MGAELPLPTSRELAPLLSPQVVKSILGPIRKSSLLPQLCLRGMLGSQTLFVFPFFLFLFFFLALCPFRAAPAAHGGSQATGPIGATATRDPSRVQPTPQLTTMQDP